MEVTAKMDPCRTGLEACERLREVPGIRVQTATALVAEERHGKASEKGRDLADRRSLALREGSTGSKQRLECMSKLDNRYIPALRVHFARSVPATLAKSTDGLGI